MNNRLLDLSEEPLHVSAHEGLLKIESRSGWIRTFPFDHVAALICSNGQITLTQAALAELAASSACVVICDSKHLPVGMLLPLVAHFRQTARFGAQASCPLPLRNRLWSGIVKAKVSAQAAALVKLHGQDCGLLTVASGVGVRNATVLEAHASRIYWPALFADHTFRRSDDTDPRNALLNYGYAVVRAIVARSLCAAGLHPGISLHHHNQYDPYPLANDMMEPFRPLVDEWAVAWCTHHPPPWQLDRPAKAGLLRRLSGRFTDGAESRTLFDWSALAAEALSRCIDGKQRAFIHPLLEHVSEENPGIEVEATEASRQ